MSKLSLPRTDRTDACRDRRARQSAMPAHVAGPLSVALVAVLGAGLVAHLLGLDATGVWAAVVATVIAAGFSAHHTIGSLAAGAGIRLAQPYTPGERVRIHLPSCGRVVEAEIVRVGPANTTVVVRNTHDGLDSLVVVPNNRMLRNEAETSMRA